MANVFIAMKYDDKHKTPFSVNKMHIISIQPNPNGGSYVSIAGSKNAIEVSDDYIQLLTELNRD